MVEQLIHLLAVVEKTKGFQIILTALIAIKTGWKPFVA